MSPSRPPASVQAALVTLSATHARTLRSRAAWVALVAFDMVTSIIREWGGWFVWVLAVGLVCVLSCIVDDLRKAHLITKAIEDVAASRP